MRRSPCLGLAVVVALAVSQAGCTVKTLVTTFNGGILDSAGDPFHNPAERSREMVKELVTHELMDGFFTQGSPGGKVATWAQQAAADPDAFVAAVYAHVTSTGGHLPWRPPRAELSAVTSPQMKPRERFEALGRRWRHQSTPLQPPQICGGDGKPSPAAGEIADAVRFDAALQRACDNVGAIAIEGLADEVQVAVGARDAFAEIAQYLGHRAWQRRFDRHVNGLVIKGGASTGLYSAGVVWVALNLIRRCMADPECSASNSDPRFALVSGTSTGAMISIATELFNNAAVNDDAGRKTALDNLAGWFTCVGTNDLYCVQDGDALKMLQSQEGMVEFDGIQNLLTKYVTCDLFKNQSELVLNAVDFRTGTLFDLSDQDELKSANDVVQGALASAVLPFIANPVHHLPVDYAPKIVPHTYLDGGVRSELPILPLARRGAERVLVVSSDASVTGEAYPLTNGLDIATRFIDVVVGGVTESEIQHAERHVESVRLAEISGCEQAPATKAACAGSASPECVSAFCEGDWAAVCDPDVTHRRSHKPATNALDLTDQRLASLWESRSFFRNETEVEGLHGYNFQSAAERRLFLAGAESARVRCAEIAQLLGLPAEKIKGNGVDWCAPVLEPAASLCSRLNLTSSNGLRDCTKAPAAPSTEVCPR